jgi:TatD DNase family protein
VLETDAPYLSPVPHRGKRNESSYIPLMAQALADATGRSLADIADITTANAARLFQTPVPRTLSAKP